MELQHAVQILRGSLAQFLVHRIGGPLEIRLDEKPSFLRVTKLKALSVSAGEALLRFVE